MKIYPYLPCKTLVVLFSAIILAGMSASTTHASLITNLEANWHLDETSGSFADASGNGNTGTAVGSPWGNGTNGLIHGAIVLNGSSDNWVQAGNMANFAITDSFSGSMWVKLNTNPNDFDFFMGQQSVSGSTIKGWRLGNGTDRSRLRFILQDGTNSTYLDSPLTALNSTAWMHLAFSYNGNASSSGMTLYINGVAITTATSGHSALNGLNASSDITTIIGTNFSLGARDADGGGKVNGLIDVVGLWNRVITQEEVTLLYNNGDGRQIIPEPATTAAILLLSVLGITLVYKRGRRLSLS
jgi:hypothetical protein